MTFILGAQVCHRFMNAGARAARHFVSHLRASDPRVSAIGHWTLGIGYFLL